MGKTTTRLTTAVETYFTDLQRVRASGGATGERSSYGPLVGLLNAIGAMLKLMPVMRWRGSRRRAMRRR